MNNQVNLGGAWLVQIVMKLLKVVSNQIYPEAGSYKEATGITLAPRGFSVHSLGTEMIRHIDIYHGDPEPSTYPTR